MEDKDFIVRVIQYLEYRFGIAFFITPKDFDCLYNWWEKRIPIRIVKESIAAVVERWQVKNKTISGFSSFRYEVRKNFKAFLQLNVGGESTETVEKTDEEAHRFAEIETFFQHFPEPLTLLKEEFLGLYSRLKDGGTVELAGLHGKLAAMFAGDRELNLKTAIFLKNLSPELRKPEIEARYRLNYLLNKFHIPDFEQF